MSFFSPDKRLREADLLSWQQVPDHLTDKLKANKNTPGLVKEQSQPQRIIWAEPSLSEGTVSIAVGIEMVLHSNSGTFERFPILPGLKALKLNFCLLKQTKLTSFCLRPGKWTWEAQVKL